MKSLSRIIRILWCCGVLLVSCGIFTPRDVFERPADDQTVTDVYNFGSLLSGTGEAFSRLDWYELFGDSLKYVNVRSGSSGYTKADLINHLNQQKTRIPGARATWTVGESYIVVNLITLSNAHYDVVDASASDSVLYSGSSSFVIRRDANNIWRIVSWTDDPTSDAAFFSPAE